MKYSHNFFTLSLVQPCPEAGAEPIISSFDNYPTARRRISVTHQDTLTAPIENHPLTKLNSQTPLFRYSASQYLLLFDVLKSHAMSERTFNDHHTPTSSSSGTSTPGAPAAPALSASWHVPLPSTVSHAMTGLLRRFSTDPPKSSTYSATKSSTSGGMDGVYTPPYRTASPFQPPPLYPVSLKGYHPSTAPSAQLLNRALAEEIRLLVPPRLQLCEEWNLVYSLEQNGVSLGTLYKKCDALRGLRNGFVLIVKDGEGGVRFPLTPLPPSSFVLVVNI